MVTACIVYMRLIHALFLTYSLHSGKGHIPNVFPSKTPLAVV